VPQVSDQEIVGEIMQTKERSNNHQAADPTENINIDTEDQLEEIVNIINKYCFDSKSYVPKREFTDVEKTLGYEE